MGKQEIIVILELLDKASTWRTMFSYSINWGSSFSTPSRVSDHNYKFNQNPAGYDYNGLFIDNSGVYAIWANDHYTDDAGLVQFLLLI